MPIMRVALPLMFCLATAPASFSTELFKAPRQTGGSHALAKQNRPGRGANRPPTQGTPAEVRRSSLERIDSRADFDELARVYYRGRFYALPHVMFVIDRRDHGRVYYVNSKAYQFHKDFVNAKYLSLERGRAFYENNYLSPARRFLLGTIARQAVVDKFTFEFWEGDRLTRQLLGESYAALSRTFYAPLFFKPTSLAQEEVAGELNKEAGAARVPLLTASELARDAEYQPLNLGAGIGQLRIIDCVTPDTVIDRNQIIIFREPPAQLTPLSGIVTTEPASPLSHVNVLAKSWAIPNAHIKDADKLFGALEGKYVKLDVRENDYTLVPADPREVAERNRLWVERAAAVTPPADINYKQLVDLKHQRARDSKKFGAKSANLGELINSRSPAVHVPPGFTVPFYYYREFLSLNDLEGRIGEAVEEDRFVHDPAYRKSRLAEIRRWIQSGRHSEAFKRAVIEKVRRDYAGRGLFVRSSTNAEDLPDFSGAGLYTTVPNVRSEEQLMDAIKAVWASVWNYEAYEARESFGMSHFAVYPAVLIQEGVDAESAGVAVTADPFDPRDRGAVYVNAKRGLGIKVVEGHRVAEQVIYRPRSGTLQVLTRSDEDTMLAFDERGGVREAKVEPSRAVLTDEAVRRLARAALQVKRAFGGRDQDIEWAYSRGRLYIVQSRPYVRGNQ
jgi:hypothetical protein